jgi:hypothetical protein
MQLVDLPLEVFRLVIASIVQELGLKRALRARVVSRMWAAFTGRSADTNSEQTFLQTRYGMQSLAPGSLRTSTSRIMELSRSSTASM